MIGRLLKLLLLGRYAAEGSDSIIDNPSEEIYSFVNTRVYPEYKPQATLYPAIIYSIDSTDPDKVKGVRSPNNVIIFDLMVLSKSYAELIQLSTLVINQLHRYKNSYNSSDSTGIGFGTPNPLVPYNYGFYNPPSTGDIQYMGGLQIQALNFKSGIDTFDDKLKIYKNSLTFELIYIDDLSIWGADILLKFTDLNLMATNINSTDDPLYTQPIALNQGVNYLYTTNTLKFKNETINPDTIDDIGAGIGGYYNYFYDPSFTSNTYRPTIKKSIENPPQYNSNNYLECGLNKYLLKNNNNVKRKYSEVTFFCVVELPGSDSTSTSSSVLFKDSNSTNDTGGIYFFTEVIGDPAAGGMVKFNSGGMALEENGGGITHRGFGFFGGLVKWPAFGLNLDLSMENPFYFSVNFKRSESKTDLSGQYEWILSSGGAGDRNNYTDWLDVCSASSDGFEDYFFTFESIHSDIGSFDTNGSGTFDMNGNINIYDFVLFPEFLTFGSTKYLQVKKQIIEKHNLWERTTY
tara:strand:- start:18355 stop:19908 length:1554 start_codon:yes stop_codon:yes gene_type:complete